jgi:hypothetical protein
MSARGWSIAWCVAFTIAGGCTPGSSRQEAPAPAEGPARAAATLQAHCADVAATEAMGCYDAGLLVSLKEGGIAEAMDVLQRLSAMDEDVKRDGHMYAHSLGLAAYSGAATVGSTFRQCLPAFQSGCYHGVIQAYFAELTGTGGEDALTDDAINDLCQDYRDSPDGDWLLFQCVHGMGHGLSQVTHHELKQTLAQCDRLREKWERQGCYGGAFMENIMEAVAPHHSVGRPGQEMDHSAMGHMAGMGSMEGMEGMEGMEHMDHAEHAAHGGASSEMQHASAEAAPAPKLIDPADPLYPCSALPDQYLNACYQMQTSVILHLNHGNIPAAARTCDRVGTDHRAQCYQSLGRDVSAYTLQDFDRAASLCSSGDPIYQPWCHIGFVKNVIDLTADYRKGMDYCRTLDALDPKKACYRAVGEEIAALTAKEPERIEACDKAEWAYRETCGIAAGIEAR